MFEQGLNKFDRTRSSADRLSSSITVNRIAIGPSSESDGKGSAYRADVQQKYLLSRPRELDYMTIQLARQRSQSTKSLVLGTAKVISYKDLEEVQTKRAEIEAAGAAKGKSNCRRKRKCSAPEAEEATVYKAKRSRKRKSTALEAGEPEPEPEVVRPAKGVINGRGKRGRRRKSAELEEDEPEPEPEAARMIEAPKP